MKARAIDKRRKALRKWSRARLRDLDRGWRRYREANRDGGWLLLLDLLGWRDTARDRVIDELRRRRAERAGQYAFDAAFARRRPRPAPARPPGGRLALAFVRVDSDADERLAPLRAALADRGHDVTLVAPVEVAAARLDLIVLAPATAALRPELIRAARGRGVATAVCVTRWQDLDEVPGLPEPPDVLMVWNEAQRHEAVARLGVPDAIVVTTGAHPYDAWDLHSPVERIVEEALRAGLPADGLPPARLGAWLRPRGLERPAAPFAVAALERAAAGPVPRAAVDGRALEPSLKSRSGAIARSAAGGGRASGGRFEV